MHPSIETAPADLMAAWRASGGALEAAMSEAPGAAGDDGLSASPITIFVPCNGDDGLTAHQVTSRAGGCPPFADDGLAAGNATRPPECWGVAVIEDDGLTASNASPTYPGFCWDRR